MADGAKKTSAYLQTGQIGLGNLLSKVKEWNELNEFLATIIEPKLWKYCRVGGLQTGQLTILAANGSVASQIRFQTADILLKCKTHPTFKMITHINSKVLPSFAYSTNSSNVLPSGRKNLAPLSLETAASLKEIAKGIDDIKLREALLRIAEHVKK